MTKNLTRIWSDKCYLYATESNDDELNIIIKEQIDCETVKMDNDNSCEEDECLSNVYIILKQVDSGSSNTVGDVKVVFVVGI